MLNTNGSIVFGEFSLDLIDDMTVQFLRIWMLGTFFKDVFMSLRRLKPSSSMFDFIFCIYIIITNDIKVFER
jgi:hypothetical protein